MGSTEFSMQVDLSPSLKQVLQGGGKPPAAMFTSIEQTVQQAIARSFGGGINLPPTSTGFAPNVSAMSQSAQRLRMRMNPAWRTGLTSGEQAAMGQASAIVVNGMPMGAQSIIGQNGVRMGQTSPWFGTQRQRDIAEGYEKYYAGASDSRARRVEPPGASLDSLADLASAAKGFGKIAATTAAAVALAGRVVKQQFEITQAGFANAQSISSTTSRGAGIVGGDASKYRSAIGTEGVQGGVGQILAAAEQSVLANNRPVPEAVMNQAIRVGRATGRYDIVAGIISSGQYGRLGYLESKFGKTEGATSFVDRIASAGAVVRSTLSTPRTESDKIRAIQEEAGKIYEEQSFRSNPLLGGIEKTINLITGGEYYRARANRSGLTRQVRDQMEESLPPVIPYSPTPVGHMSQRPFDPTTGGGRGAQSSGTLAQAGHLMLQAAQQMHAETAPGSRSTPADAGAR